jgi:hypothetical protein
VFGDPVPGIAKVCEYSSQTSTAPAPTPTPIVVQPTPVQSGGKGIFIGSKEFGSLADAGAAFVDGDTIKITKSLVDEATALTNPGSVTIECSPGVKIDWASGVNKRLAWGKGVFNVEGSTKGITVKNCEISGAQIAYSQGGNGAAVRMIDGVIEKAEFINVNFHHNNNGILGGAKVINISGSKFSYNGAGPDQDGHTHNIYISNFCDQLNVKDSYFGPVYEGNILKSRCKENNITTSQLESKGDVNSSYLLDLPNGGKSVVSYSVFVKAPNQGQRSVHSWMTEGSNPVNTLESHHNIYVNDGNANFIQGSGSLNFHDNKLVGSFSSMVDQPSSKFYANRAEAGLAAAPAIPQIPSGGIMGFFRNLF